MKNNYKLLLVIAGVTAITACSKKNNSSPTSSAIVGKWAIVSDTIRTYKATTLVETDVNDELTAADFAQFNSNGSGSTTESGISTNFTYTVSGSILTLNTPAQTIDGVSIPKSSEQATIKTLTSSVLHLYETNSYIISDTTYTQKEDVHFTK